MPTNSKDTQNLPGLDVLRGIAALCVVVFHNVPLRVTPDKSEYLAEFILRVAKSLWFGVDLFFVLSGFLITKGLLKNRECRHVLSHFYIKRILRIFPLYFFILFLYLVLFKALHLYDGLLFEPVQPFTWGLWTFTANLVNSYQKTWVYISPFFDFSHFWSLAIEEQFYLFWPWLIVFVPLRKLPFIFIGILVGGFLFRLGVYFWGWDPLTIYNFTFCRLEGLVMGALLAWCESVHIDFHWILKKSFWFNLLAIFFFCICFFLNDKGLDGFAWYIQTIGFTLLSWLSSVLLMWVLVSPGKLFFGIRPLIRCLQTVGKYSFGLYVWHVPLRVFFGIDQLYPILERIFVNKNASGLIYALCLGLISMLVAILSYHLLEEPFLKLKNRLS